MKDCAKKACSLLCVLVVAGMVLGIVTAAEASALRAGVSKVDITPEPPIQLSGYANRTEEAGEVRQPLYAKALAIESENAPLAILLVVDLISVPEWLTNDVAERLEAEAGIARAQVALAATHTHTGPALSRSIPGLFSHEMDDGTLERTDAYSNGLADKLVEAAHAAIEDLADAELAWGQGSVDFAVNRRILRDGRCVGMGPVLEGPADHDMPVLAVRDSDGALRAVLINYASHCTTLTGHHNFVHGDWAGEAAARIEAANEGAVAMIAIGCGADANPEPRGEFEHVAQHAQAIAQETAKVLEGIMTPLSRGPEGLVRAVALPFADGESELTYPIQTWAFGDELAMVFLPGEVTSPYALRLKRELDRRRLWVNAFANDDPCYITSAQEIREGGYEVERSMDFYGQPGPFSPEIEDIVIHAIHDMLTPRFAKPERARAQLREGNEPRRITGDDGGYLRLTADAGQPYGPGIAYKQEPGWESFGGWTADDHVEWQVEVPEAGAYEVWMEWSAPPHSAGHPYVFLAGDRALRGFTESTGRWEDFRRAKIGQVHIPAGSLTMALKPAADVGESLLELREIRLIPAQ